VSIDELRQLPKWKSLVDARRERIEQLEAKVKELSVKLLTLQAEAPDNTNCGWFSFGNNESFELDRQFTMTKDSIARAEAEFYQLKVADLRPSPSHRASHGSVVVLASGDDYRCFRLVLAPEPGKDDPRIVHAEMASPVGEKLLGVEEGDEILLPAYVTEYGMSRLRMEVVAVI
jgi:transcription elongation GreA/GreB family factor